VQINIGTGDDQERFDVHEALLSSRSRFSRNALSGRWKEAEDRVVKLPEDDPALFATYIHVLYSGDIPCVSDSDAIGAKESLMLCHLYMLAEKLDDVQTKNTVVEAILSYCTKPQTDGNIYYMGGEPVSVIYSGTPENSPARRLMTDLYAYRGDQGCMKHCPKDGWPPEFLYDLTVSLMAKRYR
ncbi:hypothetical protein K491DRAFT_578276, partial [Lophiostoma macrostomum CBS 122681]